MFKPKRTQEAIFASFGWWDKDCLLCQITGDRCNYIEACVNRVFGAGALQQRQILEVGCGGGLICEQLALHKAIMVGIDPSEAALATAHVHAQQSGLGDTIRYEQGFAESLPYADDSFSVIVCLDVLEHVGNLKATIAEIARVLAPGGVFIFDTINRTLIARAFLIWYGEGLATAGFMRGLHNYHDFIKPAELQALLTANDLQIHELTGFMPRGFVEGHLKMGPGWFMGVSYIGYATKAR